MMNIDIEVRPARFVWLRSYWLVVLVLLVIVGAGISFVMTRGVDPRTGIQHDLIEGEDVDEQLTVPGVDITYPSLSWHELIQTLTRGGVRPTKSRPDIEIFLASPTYFDTSRKSLPTILGDEPSLLFYVAEDSHDPLDSDPPEPLVRVNGGAPLEPAIVDVLADSSHHRTTIVGYQTPFEEGGITIPPKSTITLELAAVSDRGAPLILEWQLPTAYPNGYETNSVIVASSSGTLESPDQSVEPKPIFETTQLSWAAMVAIMAGMLTALSPCLIQLAVYFVATLSGASAETGVGDSVRESDARSHIVRTALFFSLGFTLIYTAGGAAAGYVGQSLDQLGLLDDWLRPFAILAGIVIIMLAVRVAWKARAPLVCKLPPSPIFGSGKKTGMMSSALMGLSFAGGCLACFSASILPALLLYAGSTGSVAYGATLLFLFSLGISIPCMLLAFGVSRFTGIVRNIDRYSPALGLLSAIVMVMFGVIMITDQFHVVSGIIGETFNI